MLPRAITARASTLRRGVARLVGATRRTRPPVPRLIAIDGDHEALQRRFDHGVDELAGFYVGWRSGATAGAVLAQALIDIPARLNDGNTWHPDGRLRSYVDISIEVLLLHVFVEHLPALGGTATPDTLLALLLEHRPDARAALIVDGDRRLAAGDLAGAVAAAQRALRVLAVGPTAQDLLMRACREPGAEATSATPIEIAAARYDVSDKFCLMPFTHLSTGFQGQTFPCSCPAWVPYSIGSLLEAESPDAVWNSPAAAVIRRSILDGDFRYCSRTMCSYLNTQKLPRRSEMVDAEMRRQIETDAVHVEQAPRMVELNHDPTCNLACPSCRVELITKSTEADAHAPATARTILPLLKRVTGQTYITGGGEAFASRHFRGILRALNRAEYPGLRVYLITNGQLLTPARWREYPDLPAMLSIVSVSMDAARPETYERLRRPGKWEPLMENLRFLARMRRDGEVPRIGLNFCVQRDNFREMLEFVALGDELGVDTLWFQRLVNYGTYDEATFAGLNVSSPSHPDHPELLEILRHPSLRKPRITMNMLLALLPEFVASDERIGFLY
jgi:hypothetical protein